VALVARARRWRLPASRSDPGGARVASQKRSPGPRDAARALKSEALSFSRSCGFLPRLPRPALFLVSGSDEAVLTGSSVRRHWRVFSWYPMPSVAFTCNLQRHVACPPCTVRGVTVREAWRRLYLYPQAGAMCWTSTAPEVPYGGLCGCIPSRTAGPQRPGVRVRRDLCHAGPFGAEMSDHCCCPPARDSLRPPRGKGDWELDSVSFLGTTSRSPWRIPGMAPGTRPGPRPFRRQAAPLQGPRRHLAGDRRATYPTPPEGHVERTSWAGRSWRLIRFWSLAPGMHAASLLWAGTIPAACSGARTAATPGTCGALWHMPERRKWAGGGADAPGIHSIRGPGTGTGWSSPCPAAACGNTSDWGRPGAPHDGHAADYAPPSWCPLPIPGSAPLWCSAPGADTWWIQHHNAFPQHGQTP